VNALEYYFTRTVPLLFYFTAVFISDSWSRKRKPLAYYGSRLKKFKENWSSNEGFHTSV